MSERRIDNKGAEFRIHGAITAYVTARDNDKLPQDIRGGAMESLLDTIKQTPGGVDVFVRQATPKQPENEERF